MQFIIKNIVKIEEADITLDGMTIIAGENNVGAIEDYQIDKEEKGDNEFEESEEQLYKIIKEFCLDFVYLYDKENQEAAYEKYNE